MSENLGMQKLVEIPILTYWTTGGLIIASETATGLWWSLIYAVVSFWLYYVSVPLFFSFSHSRVEYVQVENPDGSVKLYPVNSSVDFGVTQYKVMGLGLSL